MTGEGGWLPPHAHVPGVNARHPDGLFDAIRDSAHPGMSVDELAQSPAFACGVRFHRAGFFWEAHEVWEAVWMACSEAGADKPFVQGLIQLANARLKLAMARPKAALRLCDLAAHCLDIAAVRSAGRDMLLGLPVAGIRAEITAVRQSAIEFMQNNAETGDA